MSAADMPKLPEAGWMLWCHNAYENPYHSHQDGYTDDEMREYARAHAAAVAAPLVGALQMLYDETADYIRLNNLGGMDNQCMQLARAALAAFKEKA